jgi:thioesterase domain-containing protein
MQVEAVSASADAIVLSAPLAPNINHRETVFGGSASALAILAAWSLLHTRLQAEQIACQLVIQRNAMEYELPIEGAFHATARLANPEGWPRFLLMLSRKGRARITVSSVLEFNGSPAGRFSGEFVALRR